MRNEIKEKLVLFLELDVIYLENRIVHYKNESNYRVINLKMVISLYEKEEERLQEFNHLILIEDNIAYITSSEIIINCFKRILNNF